MNIIIRFVGDEKRYEEPKHKGEVLTFLLAIAICNAAFWFLCFCMNAALMETIWVNSGEWFDAFEKGTTYLLYLASSHAALIVAQILNYSWEKPND